MSCFHGINLFRSENDYFLEKATVFALLVNQKGVVLYQQLEECFEGIEPTFYRGTHSTIFVDLGNSTMCALRYGKAAEHDHGRSQVLCISVFTLAKAECDFDTYTGANIGTDHEAPSSKEQRFLTVHVLRKRVFTI